MSLEVIFLNHLSSILIGVNQSSPTIGDKGSHCWLITSFLAIMEMLTIDNNVV